MNGMNILNKQGKSWNDIFLSFAIMYSTVSKDPSTQVGCVIVDQLNKPVGWGTNGFSRQSSDNPELFNNREEKYKRVLHAEENAIYNSTRDTHGCTAYLTHPPCLHCCHALSQNGIVKVVAIKPSGEFASRWNLEETESELRDLGIEFLTYDEVSEETLLKTKKQFDKLLGR